MRRPVIVCVPLEAPAGQHGPPCGEHPPHELVLDHDLALLGVSDERFCLLEWWLGRHRGCGRWRRRFSNHSRRSLALGLTLHRFRPWRWKDRLIAVQDDERQDDREKNAFFHEHSVSRAEADSAPGRSRARQGAGSAPDGAAPDRIRGGPRIARPPEQRKPSMTARTGTNQKTWGRTAVDRCAAAPGRCAARASAEPRRAAGHPRTWPATRPVPRRQALWKS